jgi:hypothetical protein
MKRASPCVRSLLMSRSRERQVSRSGQDLRVGESPDQVVVSRVALERAVQHAATAAQLPPELAATVLQRFKAENERATRSLRRAARSFLEILYQLAFPMSRRKNFLTPCG